MSFQLNFRDSWRNCNRLSIHEKGYWNAINHERNSHEHSSLRAVPSSSIWIILNPSSTHYFSDRRAWWLFKFVLRLIRELISSRNDSNVYRKWAQIEINNFASPRLPTRELFQLPFNYCFSSPPFRWRWYVWAIDMFVWLRYRDWFIIINTWRLAAIYHGKRSKCFSWAEEDFPMLPYINYLIDALRSFNVDFIFLLSWWIRAFISMFYWVFTSEIQKLRRLNSWKYWFWKKELFTIRRSSLQSFKWALAKF